MKFVKINGIIYDYSAYRLNVSTITKAINEEIENSIAKLGFARQKDNFFYNKKFDIALTISIKNKSKLKFV
jgi:hypothetical protein